MQEIILIRGLPGSGKTTFAERLRDALTTASGLPSPNDQYYGHLEADMYFDEYHDGKFEGWLIPQAHDWCQAQAEMSLEQGENVIISNTFSTIKEMTPYLELAGEHGARVTVIECQGDYSSIHDVPEKTIDKMKQRWEKYP